MNTERPRITIVTRNGENNKGRTFQAALPDWQVTRRDPVINETIIQEFAPDTAERPVFIAEAKALFDIPWVAASCFFAQALTEEAKTVAGKDSTMFLYTDSVQFIYEPDGSFTIHEKPEGDPLAWAQNAPDALAQSGKTIEIVSALTAIRCGKDGISDPATVIVRAKASMRDFTREELVEYARGSGADVIPNTAGGISLANGGRQFYDTSKPLVISVQEGIGGESVEMLRYETWNDVPDAVLRPFTCGAFEPAVIRLAQKTKAN